MITKRQTHNKIVTATFLNSLSLLKSNMVITQQRSRRTPTGARYTSTLPKRLVQRGSHPTKTGIGETKVTKHRVKGGQRKNKLLRAKTINVFDAAKKKHVQAEIKTVVENTANRHFVRRNIMTKGAVVDTSVGKVRITSRPGQEGTLNGVKAD